MGNITLNHITKIEGHARLDLAVNNGKVEKCELGSIEGSRYFEGLLKGRNYNEAQEISTRICGICSSAHNAAAIMAVENALKIKPSDQTVNLRYFQTIAERIRSHATHLYFLALPDYMGYESALKMAPKFKKEVATALRLMKIGNDMVSLVSGRVMHPTAPTIGGFLSFPKNEELDMIRDRLEKCDADVLETEDLFASLEYPDFERKTQYMSIVNDKEFGTSYGKIKIGGGVFEQSKFHDLVKEYHEEFSTANFAVREGKSYSVGALARINNNREKLSKQAQQLMKGTGLEKECHNPFKNNIAQAIELVHYRDECLKLLDNMEVESEDLAKFDLLEENHGIAANEAPRGTLWHEYKIDKSGKITFANILTPTAQFLRNLNEDIKDYVQQLLDKKKGEAIIKNEIEKLIRSYDPCFSCSSHFLTVNWKHL